MKTLFLQLSFCFIFINFSCVESNSQSTGNSSDAVKTTEMKWSQITAGNQCGVEVAKNVVVKTQKEFDDLWKECFQNMPVTDPKPTIDFSKDWVVAVFLGTINKGGHSIAIDSVSGSKISLVHTQPGKNCLSTMSIEFPYVIARVEGQAPTKVDYDISEKIVECN